ncbi:alpha/beta fold hydrolase [Pigmentiphaga litoralis]|uniref:alpha/beta fold hydrolase n=1 Tax=Pigmentiphaga litoralis TaxID=516702 RepID=UPI00167B5294|nr:alpha/beta fold hydrolase [Pigmentiphaga litoralis]
MTSRLQHDSETGTVTTRDGTSIAFTHYLNEQAPARLLLVHSLAMDRHFWDPVVALLADEASIVAVDARGHGQSDKPGTPFTVELFAQDMKEVVDALQWTDVVIAGASMGGCVALQFAADNPDLTRGAGLIDTTAWYGETAPADWNARAERGLKEGLGALLDFQKTRWFSDRFRDEHPEVVQRCIDTFLRNDVQAFAATCRMLGAYDGRTQLGKITAPTAVVVGEEDYAATPAMARVMHEGIPHSTLTEIPAARHLTPLETPEIIADHLRRLLGARA